MIETKSLYGGVHVISPKTRFRIAITRFIRETMTSQIQSDEPVVIRQIRTQLPAPRERALGKAVNEQNWASVWVARLNEMELCTSSANDFLILHHCLLLFSVLGFQTRVFTIRRIWSVV